MTCGGGEGEISDLRSDLRLLMECATIRRAEIVCSGLRDCATHQTREGSMDEACQKPLDEACQVME